MPRIEGVVIWWKGYQMTEKNLLVCSIGSLETTTDGNVSKQVTLRRLEYTIPTDAAVSSTLTQYNQESASTILHPFSSLHCNPPLGHHSHSSSRILPQVSCLLLHQRSP
jgi:hypothetical protein